MGGWANIGALIGSALASPGAVDGLVNGLRGNQQYAAAASTQLTNLQVALAATPQTPQSSMAAMFALNALTTMVTNNQLPAQVGPQLTALANPAVQNSPVAVAQAIATIHSILHY